MTQDPAKLIAKIPLLQATGANHAPLAPHADTTNDWQRQLAYAINDLPTLLSFLNLDIQDLVSFYQKEVESLAAQDETLFVTPEETVDIGGFLAAAHSKQFPIRVPHSFAQRIAPSTPGDPLLRQVLPTPMELKAAPGFVTDPLAEKNSIAGQGLLQKYQGRILVVAHGSCAVHCRYCFRRHFPYDTQQLPPQQWQALAAYLAQDKTLDEVILSGGDPLTLKNRQLAQLNTVLTANPHIKRLRIHTRFPIMIPDRIDDGFLAWVNSLPIPLTLVFHINHANEIDADTGIAIARLRQETRSILLNQSVLLRNVNDTLSAQQNLQEKLITYGVLPYYLHLLDPIQGAHHFNVPKEEALTLIQAMQHRLPGYMVPKLVREEAGAASKTLLIP